MTPNESFSDYIVRTSHGFLEPPSNKKSNQSALTYLPVMRLRKETRAIVIDADGVIMPMGDVTMLSLVKHDYQLTYTCVHVNRAGSYEKSADWLAFSCGHRAFTESRSNSGHPDVNLLRLIADGYVIATFCDVLLSIWPDPDPSEFSFVGVWLERDAHRRKYEIPPQ